MALWPLLHASTFSEKFSFQVHHIITKKGNKIKEIKEEDEVHGREGESLPAGSSHLLPYN
jgi:hypothetical protein